MTRLELLKKSVEGLEIAIETRDQAAIYGFLKTLIQQSKLIQKEMDTFAYIPSVVKCP